MGQNSTEVAYGFGQMGSVFTNLAKPVFPPKDHVIVAVQFLADNTPTSMVTETLDSMGPQFPSTGTTEASDNNYLGVCESAASGAGSSAGVVTIVANAKIKKGQYIIIGADGDAIGTGITLDTSAGHITPIYQGPNAQGLIVKDIDGTSLTISNADGSTFDASNLDASNTLYFLDEVHGVGGTATDAVVFPKGVTIYGRWTTIVPSAAPVICYFGK
tara:strand:- start:140 stop:787 length:648 start_codon:yes stop_codon:yes gene_type:complete